MPFDNPVILRFPSVTGALKLTRSFPVTTLAELPKNKVVGLLFDKAVEIAVSIWPLVAAPASVDESYKLSIF